MLFYFYEKYIEIKMIVNNKKYAIIRRGFNVNCENLEKISIPKKIKELKEEGYKIYDFREIKNEEV